VQRDLSIDIFKGLLVVGMVYAHVLQFFGDFRAYPMEVGLSDFFNLITFSGFVFSFGFVSQIAYYRKSFREVYVRMVTTSFKLLIAFYISGVFFRMFIDNRPLLWNATLKPILLLQDIPGWSEFLASFFAITLAGVLLFRPLQWLLAHQGWFWLTVPALLATTFIPYESVTSTQLGLLIGTKAFAAFPVVQYFPFYLLGMYFAKNGIGWNAKVFAASLLCSGVFVYFYATHGEQLPSRFPPSWIWIVAPNAVLYGYYLCSKSLRHVPIVGKVLESIGRNVLFYLLFSNLFIFTLRSKVSFGLDVWEGAAFAVLILGITGYLTAIMGRTLSPRPNKR
jgi:fucose 4-O-acetylase-like acetyltransferase